MQIVPPLNTDPSSNNMRFDYNRKSYVTAHLSGSAHGEKEIDSEINSQEDMQQHDDHNGIIHGSNYESMRGDAS